ncbi:MAG: DUF2335 domain-containing protein [Melioribacteraceae bacterium]
MSQKNKGGNLPQKNSGYTVTAHHSELYVGPLPKPETLKQFDDIVPGAAERIITQFEEQSRHRRSLEQVVISNDVKLSQRGLVFGFIIGMVAIICGGILAFLGREIAGSFIGGGGVVGLVSVFIYGSQSKRKHLQNRQS